MHPAAQRHATDLRSGMNTTVDANAIPTADLYALAALARSSGALLRILNAKRLTDTSRRDVAAAAPGLVEFEWITLSEEHGRNERG
jgi:tRNA A37 threonylcarbamoyladenosine synthetase subunit TsaC/SUA5/YrdC